MFRRALRLAVAILGTLAAKAVPTAHAQVADSGVGAQAPDSLARQRASAAPQRVPISDTVTLGGRVIKAGERVEGPIVVAGGDIVVRGTVLGSAISIAGDVVVHDGGSVSGDALAVFGDVRREGGTVGGTMRSMTGRWGESLRSSMRGENLAPSKRTPLSLALGWFGIMLLIGLGVLVFASSYLDGVVDVLQQSFWRAFLVGIAGELGVLPAMVLLVVALAVTIIGALLIPFAVVAFVLAVAGLATLGFVAVARVTGEGFASRSARRLTERGGALRAVLLGVTLYMGIWVLATAVGAIPAVGTTLRLLAALVTYVALTAGFGAAILSRAGTKRDATIIAAPAPAMDAASWQTPTPVTGVVAARRPSPRKADATLK